MFLDEELEQIHVQKDKDLREKSMLMLKAMISRMPSEKDVMTIAPWDFFNTLKRIDNGWRLFCKRHNEYKKDAWRNWVLRSDENDKFKKALGW